MFAVGASLGPFMHYWYHWLDRLYVGRAMKTVTKKVLIDQLVGSPTIGFIFFMGEDDFEFPVCAHTPVCWHNLSHTHTHTLPFTPVKQTHT